MTDSVKGISQNVPQLIKKHVLVRNASEGKLTGRSVIALDELKTVSSKIIPRLLFNIRHCFYLITLKYSLKSSSYKKEIRGQRRQFNQICTKLIVLDTKIQVSMTKENASLGSKERCIRLIDNTKEFNTLFSQLEQLANSQIKSPYLQCYIQKALRKFKKINPAEEFRSATFLDTCGDLLRTSDKVVIETIEKIVPGVSQEQPPKKAEPTPPPKKEVCEVYTQAVEQDVVKQRLDEYYSAQAHFNKADEGLKNSRKEPLVQPKPVSRPGVSNGNPAKAPPPPPPPPPSAAKKVTLSQEEKDFQTAKTTRDEARGLLIKSLKDIGVFVSAEPVRKEEPKKMPARNLQLHEDIRAQNSPVHKKKGASTPVGFSSPAPTKSTGGNPMSELLQKGLAKVRQANPSESPSSEQWEDSPVKSRARSVTN